MALIVGLAVPGISVVLDVQGPVGITVELTAVVETECDMRPENDSDTIREPLHLC